MKAPLAVSTVSVEAKSHEQSFLMSELESLGLSSIRLNEFNDNVELKRLVNAIKEALLEEYKRSVESRS